MKLSQKLFQKEQIVKFPLLSRKALFSELGIDSLDTVELLMNLEDEIGIEIELDQKVETVADLVKFIESKQ